MSAATDSSATTGDGGDSERPQVEALFLIRFDKKVGYTIAWKRTKTDIELENAVEFKSLPSGLHAVQSDLVYFTHGGYAGLSAFAKADASAQERNANFIAVGILAKREGEHGRLGRGWLLAGQLEELAATLAKDSEHVTPLEDFWQEQAAPANRKENGSNGHSRARATSTVSAVSKEDDGLPDYHPARSILQYIDAFGPLVFRLQQAALLRKRILFVGVPPVRRMCEFVYNLSVLSSISPRDSGLLGPGTDSLLRLATHFSIGVHDIPWLEAHKQSNSTTSDDDDDDAAAGWAACTTDEIITSKPQLYDIVVELPQVHDAPLEQRRWPRLRTNDGSLVKASQRDVARYKLLHKELFKHRNRSSPTAEAYHDDDDEDDDETETAPLISQSEIEAKRADDEYNESYDDTVVEPVTWSRLAYSGFMWWASAGEKDAYMIAERDGDRDLIGNLEEYERSVETGVIAYFHRQTSALVQGLSQLIESGEDDEGQERSRVIGRNDEGSDEGESETLLIDRNDLSRLGLDTWSETDRAFVSEFGQMYFGQRVEVRGNEVDCCGLRVPVF